MVPARRDQAELGDGELEKSRNMPESNIIRPTNLAFALALATILLARVYLLPDQPLFSRAAAPVPDEQLVAIDIESEPTPDDAKEAVETLPVGGTCIHALPFVIDRPGYYYFQQDQVVTTGGLFINADDVTVDLGGFTLIGIPAEGADGIRIAGRRNVEIRNGTIKTFGGHGIYETGENNGGSGHRILNLRLLANSLSGVRLSGSGHFVAHCTVRSNTEEGIYLADASTVIGNLAEENGKHGIYLGAGSTARNNTVTKNHDIGLLIGPGGTATGNTIVSNAHVGLFAMTGATIADNTIHGSGNAGILAGPGCTIRSNTIWNNQDNGIDADNGSTIEGNTVYGNQRNGIAVDADVTLRANTIRDNAADGILTGAAALLAANTVRNNQHCGIQVGAGSLLRENLVNGNNQADDPQYAGVKITRRCRVLQNSLAENKHYNLLVIAEGNVIEGNLLADSTCGIYFQVAGNFEKDNYPLNHKTPYAGKIPAKEITQAQSPTQTAK